MGYDGCNTDLSWVLSGWNGLEVMFLDGDLTWVVLIGHYSAEIALLSLGLFVGSL